MFQFVIESVKHYYVKCLCLNVSYMYLTLFIKQNLFDIACNVVHECNLEYTYMMLILL